MWAVKFDNGELHRYNTEQMRAKFGVEHVSFGTEVTHAAHGHGTVLEEIMPALESPNALKRVSTGLRDKFNGFGSVKQLEEMAAEAVGLASEKGYALLW